ETSSIIDNGPTISKRGRMRIGGNSAVGGTFISAVKTVDDRQNHYIRRNRIPTSSADRVLTGLRVRFGHAFDGRFASAQGQRLIRENRTTAGPCSARRNACLCASCAQSAARNRPWT